jgi:hypothetical protein
MVIGLYELLGNPTTLLIEPPGPLKKKKKIVNNLKRYSLEHCLSLRETGTTIYIVQLFQCIDCFINSFNAFKGVYLCLWQLLIFSIINIEYFNVCNN